MKRRRLQKGQEVLIVYIRRQGYVRKKGQFLRYERVPFGTVTHETPVFQYDDKEISGLDCFWVLPDDKLDIDDIQKSIIDVQIKALQLGHELGYHMPNKLTDKKVEEVAKQQVTKLSDKLGFDPTDQSWIETDLAVTEREQKWFRFERTSDLSFMQLLHTGSWNDIITLYNQKFGDDIELEQAKKLSLKRMRYIFGSNIPRLAGNSDRNAWKEAARKFEERHRKIEDRMRSWAESKEGRFPKVKTKKEMRFYPDPYFNECVEKIPHYFTDLQCNVIRPGSELRIVAYDPESKYLKLDFPADICQLIKPQADPDKPWISDGADYVFMVDKDSVSDYLEFLENLD